MSLSGTDVYDGVMDLPPLVERAVRAARRHGFPYSCRPEQGRLLQVLAGGARHRIAETGTGLGVGLAWLASGAPEGTELISVERDADRARAAEDIFADLPHVRVRCADWNAIEEHAPYDLLVLDGGGQGKGKDAADVADPARLLVPGGTVVIDDFTPAHDWPPLFGGDPDTARLHWLQHPHLLTAEVRLASDLSTLLGTFLPGRPTGTAL